MGTSEKKNFKGTDNPALSFITPLDDKGEYTPHTDKTQDTQNTSYTDNRQDTQDTSHAGNTQNTQKTSYANNTHNEKKSKRLNLLLPPSLHHEIVDIAWGKRVSTNELIVQLLRNCVKENGYS